VTALKRVDGMDKEIVDLMDGVDRKERIVSMPSIL
jgi:hypothetical protein